MGTDYGIYPWVGTLVMGNLMERRFWVGCGWFFLGGPGRGRGNSRTRPAWSFFRWTTRVPKQLFMLHIIYWSVVISLHHSSDHHEQCPRSSMSWEDMCDVQVSTTRRLTVHLLTSKWDFWTSHINRCVLNIQVVFLNITYFFGTTPRVRYNTKKKNPCLLGKMFESRFPHVSGREEG